MPISQLLVNCQSVGLSFGETFDASSHELQTVNVLYVPVVDVFPSVTYVLLIYAV